MWCADICSRSVQSSRSSKLELMMEFLLILCASISNGVDGVGSCWNRNRGRQTSFARFTEAIQGSLSSKLHWIANAGRATSTPLNLTPFPSGRAFGYADMSDGFLRLIVIDQGFEQNFFAITDSILANGGTFFDVGVNYGLLSTGFRKATLYSWKSNCGGMGVSEAKRRKALENDYLCRVHDCAKRVGCSL
jgi:hypothetical protein